MNLHKMAVGARLLLPLYVAGILFVQNPIPDSMVLMLTLLLMGAIAMFFDQNTKPLKNRAWFHIETFVRVALICSAMFNSRDFQEGYTITLLALLIFPMLAIAVQGLNKDTSLVPIEVGLGAVFLATLGWAGFYAVGKNEYHTQWSIPAAPLWLVGAVFCGCVIFSRENVWKSLAGTRLLCTGQKKFLWKKLLTNKTPDQYWELVHNYFRDMQWGPKRPWLQHELDTAVAVAPIEFLLQYAWAHTHNPEQPPHTPAWNRGPALRGNEPDPLDRALFSAVGSRMQTLDYRAAIAWSLTSSAWEALNLYARMCNPPPAQETLALPTL